jgi:hypothetical protein
MFLSLIDAQELFAQLECSFREDLRGLKSAEYGGLIGTTEQAAEKAQIHRVWRKTIPQGLNRLRKKARVPKVRRKTIPQRLKPTSFDWT